MPHVQMGRIADGNPDAGIRHVRAAATRENRMSHTQRWETQAALIGLANRTVIGNCSCRHRQF